MPLPKPLRFIQPKLVVKNLTTSKSVVVIGKYNLAPGETADLFQVVAPGSLTEDQIIRSLFLPDGDMYVEVVLKGTLKVLEIDLPSFYYSRVFPTNLVAATQVTAGAFPVAISEDEFRWYTFQSPLVLQDDKLVLPKASPTQDGYLSKEDYALFASVAAGGNFTIWQYQDFTAPVGTSLTLTAFENGSGLAFNSAYIISGTASVVLISDTERPPTAVVSVPGVWLASNRVEVSSHIGTTVILNQAPHSSLSVRVFYQIALPAGISTPAGYEEDPNFVNERELDFFDDFYVNQNSDETIYGTKTFNDTLQIDGSLVIPTGAVDGYYLRSNGSGTAAWAPVVGVGGTADHGALTGLADDDHPQYYNQARLDLLIDGYEPSDSERLLPAGGTTGQALVKTSNSDYDVQWEDVATGTSLDLSSLDVILDGYVSNTTFATTIDGYTTDGEFSAHTGDTTIHFTAESLNLEQYITATELDAILDGYGGGSGDVSLSFLDAVLDGYATNSDLASHTNDATIHFTAESLNLEQYINAVELDAILDGYALTSEIITDHGGLSGLSDDDHPQYFNSSRLLPILDGYTTDVEFGAHTSDATIHFTVDSLNLDQYISQEELDVVLDGYVEEGSLDSILDGYATIAQLDLHTNDITIHFTVGDLGLDGYFYKSADQTVTGHTTFDPSVATDPAITISPNIATPTTNVADGSVAIVGGIQYNYDNARAKWLSNERKFLVSGRNSNNVTNAYINVVDSVVSSSTGYRLLRDATITGLWAQTEGIETWVFEVRRNGDVTAVASLSVTASRGDSNSAANIDVDANDEIQFYVNGTGIGRPVVGIELAWRIV